MKLYPLTPGQVILLLVLVAIADAFTFLQSAIFPAAVRPITYLLFVILVLLAFFFVVSRRTGWHSQPPSPSSSGSSPPSSSSSRT